MSYSVESESYSMHNDEIPQMRLGAANGDNPMPKPAEIGSRDMALLNRVNRVMSNINAHPTEETDNVLKVPEIGSRDMALLKWINRIISKINMRPIEETDNVFKFTLSGLNVSLANAL